MRPIDADALISKYGDWYTEEGTEEGFIGTVKMLVGTMPTIEPERKKGRWKHVDPITAAMGPRGWMPWYCSECGAGVGKHQTTFCPNCGADMRGEQDE